MALAGGAVAAAEGGRGLAVVYPELAEPFRQVFASIIEGIEERLGARVASFVVGSGAHPAQVAEDIRKREVQVLIGLGRGGMRIAATLAGEMSVLVGCVVSVQESEARSFPVHTLAPDPALLLARLRRLRPGVRRVHLRIYTQLLANADPARDALWLPQDPTTVDDNAVLPLVLREGWNRNIVVFSSHVAHVRRGALFSLYPDNRELGRSLAASAQRLAQSPKAPASGVVPLRQTLAAINIRTAAHLGIDAAAMQSGFDLVYPSN